MGCFPLFFLAPGFDAAPVMTFLKEAMNSEILRIVDAIHRDKEIEKEVIFLGIESALKTAAKKRLGQDADINITIDRQSGDINATLDGNLLAPKELGRIAALNAKQIIMQKIREAERDVVFGEFTGKIGSIMTGAVTRIEGSNVIVNVAKTEAVLPRKEQVYSESYQLGDRMKFRARLWNGCARAVMRAVHPRALPPMPITTIFFHLPLFEAANLLIISTVLRS